MKRRSQEFKSTQSYQGWSKSRKFPLAAKKKSDEPTPFDKRVEAFESAVEKLFAPFALWIYCAVAIAFIIWLLISLIQTHLAPLMAVIYFWFLIWLFSRSSGGGHDGPQHWDQGE